MLLEKCCSNDISGTFELKFSMGVSSEWYMNKKIASWGPINALIGESLLFQPKRS